MKERYNDGQCVVEGLAGEELRQIVASPDTGEAGDPSQVAHSTLSTKSQDADIITIAKPLLFLLVPQIG